MSSSWLAVFGVGGSDGVAKIADLFFLVLRGFGGHQFLHTKHSAEVMKHKILAVAIFD